MKLTNNFIVKILCAILSGLMLSSGFPGYHFPTLGLPYICAIAFVPLFWVIFNLHGNRVIKKSIFYILIFGLTFQLTAFLWVSQPIIYFSGLSELLGYAVFGLIAILSSFYFVLLLSPLLFYLWARKTYPKTFAHIFIVAILITALEILIPRIFHWSIGQIFNKLYFWQLSSLFGFNTGTFIILLSNLSITALILNYKNKSFLAKNILFNTAMWTAVFLYGFIRINLLIPEIENSPKVRIAFIQPNFTFQELASKRIHAKNAHKISLETVMEMSQQVVNKSLAYDNKKPDLLVWPESVAPDTIFVNKMLSDTVQKLSKQIDVPILLQDVIVKHKDPADTFWSVWSVSKIITDEGVGHDKFEKWVPIPFGESLPFENFFPKLGQFYRKLIQNSSKVEAGTSFDALSVKDKFFVAPLICFDGIYQRLPYLQSKYGKADLYINQANFMWMVDSNAGLEFSYLDKARGIENARSMIMVSNTGPTIAFDPLGRVIWGPSDIMSSDMGFFDVPIYSGKTVFSYVFNWPLLILAVCALYKLLYLFRSRSS